MPGPQQPALPTHQPALPLQRPHHGWVGGSSSGWCNCKLRSRALPPHQDGCLISPPAHQSSCLAPIAEHKCPPNQPIPEVIRAGGQFPMGMPGYVSFLPAVALCS